MLKRTLFLLFILFILLSSCAEKAKLGTKSNPIKLFFVPSMEGGKVVTSANKIAEILHKETGLYFESKVPTSYAAVIEAMGTNEADIAFLSTFAYIVAKKEFDVDVQLKTIRYGQDSYKGQFVALKDSNINTLEDINGKIIGYTDALSTSGYIYPAAILKQKGIEPANKIFAGSHPAALIALMDKNVDVACTYYSPEHNGVPQDARIKLIDTYPNIIEDTKIIGLTDPIPNDTVTFRKNFDKEMKEKIVNALLKIVSQEEGKKIMEDLYNVNGFVKTSDADYEVVRKALDALGFDPNKMIN